LGPNGWTTPLVGIATYLSALPVVIAAMIVTLIMMSIASQFAPANGAIATPVHPIVEQILRGDWTIRLQLLFVAVFAAVPEEIMFRGVLYRHLREATSKLGGIGSVIFASLISSFVFAVIHPQGLFGIPILMSLAMVFAIVREWRGSLVPCMIAHAMVNAGTSLILLMIAD
jgi:membrane protease YdiL (CAAX protease family)